MSRLMELVKEAPVHERRLEFKSFPVADNRLVVEGWLHDERFADGYHWNGSARPAGVVHWMCVRLLVGGWPLSILDAEAEMPNVPHELCPTTLDSVKKVIGLSIAHGYSEEVRHRLGGTQGCTHMTTLLIAMGPAAIHGYWTQLSRQPRPAPQSLEDLPGLAAVINTCALWTEDGPFLTALRETMGGGPKE